MKEIRIKGVSPVALLKRFNLVIFIVIIAAMLSASILLLYDIVNKASGEDAIPLDNVTTGFDQTTISAIEELKTSDQSSTPLDFSQGRINPFGE